MNMWMMITVSVSLSVAFTLLVCLAVQKMKHKKINSKENSALKGIVAGIGNRLHADFPGSKWKWVCRPVEFALNGGVARIEVLDQSNKVCFMDVCLSAKGYMALHVLNVVELTTSGLIISPADVINSGSPATTAENPVSTTAPTTGIRPNDEESVIKWYNIILIDALTALIDDLNAKGEVCLYIDQNGKAYVEEGSGVAVIYEFGGMPDVALWSHITDKLGDAGLFTEIREGNCMFISWA